MPKRTSQAQKDKWKNVPVEAVFHSGRPNQHAIDVIMASIEEFIIAERIKEQDAAAKAAEASDPVSSEPVTSEEAG